MHTRYVVVDRGEIFEDRDVDLGFKGSKLM
jgi:hypothetical protein